MTTEDGGAEECSEPNLAYLFPSYLIGDLEPQQQEKIEKHLETCASCRRDMKFFADLQDVGKEIYRDEEGGT
jgi:anti-sigma factor RsiW